MICSRLTRIKNKDLLKFSKKNGWKNFCQTAASIFVDLNPEHLQHWLKFAIFLTKNFFRNNPGERFDSLTSFLYILTHSFFLQMLRIEMFRFSSKKWKKIGQKNSSNWMWILTRKLTKAPLNPWLAVCSRSKPTQEFTLDLFMTKLDKMRKIGLILNFVPKMLR